MVSLDKREEIVRLVFKLDRAPYITFVQWLRASGAILIWTVLMRLQSGLPSGRNASHRLRPGRSVKLNIGELFNGPP
jgi:hypothetical protein